MYLLFIGLKDHCTVPCFYSSLHFLVKLSFDIDLFFGGFIRRCDSIKLSILLFFNNFVVDLICGLVVLLFYFHFRSNVTANKSSR